MGSVCANIHVWAGKRGEAANCSLHGIQDSVIVCGEQLRNRCDKAGGRNRVAANKTPSAMSRGCSRQRPASLICAFFLLGPGGYI